MRPSLAILTLSGVLGLAPVPLAHADVPCPPELVGPGLSYADNLPDATGFVDAALEAGAELGAQNTLLVLDIDNTLLAMLDDLGSEQWYQWQRALLARAGPDDGEVAPDFQGLLGVQQFLLSTRPMRLTQPDMAQVVSTLQALDYPVMALSARGPEALAATRRELARNGIDLSRTAPAGLPEMARPHRPFEAANPSEAGLSAEEVAAHKLGTPQPVIYTDGVYLVAGQHKGAMLHVLLHRLGKHYPAIVFLDDGTQNVCEMTQAFQDPPDVLTALRYDAERLRTKAFLHDPGRQTASTRDWHSITARLPAVCGALPDACGLEEAPGADPTPPPTPPVTEPEDPVVTTGLPVPPADSAGQTLRDWLKTHWYDGKHRTVGYNAARRAMYSSIDVAEDGRVYGVYSRFSQPAAETTFLNPINAEHTVPQSWFSKNEPMRSDIHHLFPTHMDVNSARGSDPFGEIPDGSTSRWYGLKANGQLAKINDVPAGNRDTYSEDRADEFEPREAHEGDLARAVFYFYTMYPGRARSLGAIAKDGTETLYQWHVNDPPDAWERQRNHRIEVAQGNRNPYIDHPALVCRAWGFDCR